MASQSSLADLAALILPQVIDRLARAQDDCLDSDGGCYTRRL
jgi:hypothetical protein